MGEPNLAFDEWRAAWEALAEFRGPQVPDEEALSSALVAHWNKEIPAGWKRDADKRLLDRDLRYRRRSVRSKEGPIEAEILAPDPAATPTHSLGLRLVDGVNAVPLTKDAAGGRAGNVEADMLLLVRDDREYRLHLVEVKFSSDYAWYAVIENLRALKLLSQSDVPQRLFHERCPELKLPEELRVTAVTLAPPAYYVHAGRRSLSVAPAHRLHERMRAECGVDAVLGTWDPSTRRIEPL